MFCKLMQPLPQPEPPQPPSTDQPDGAQLADEQASNGSSNGEAEAEPEPEPIQAEIQPAPAPPPVWKRGFDVALNTLEQQIKDLEVSTVMCRHTNHSALMQTKYQCS